MTLYRLIPDSDAYYTLNRVNETPNGRTRLIRGDKLGTSWEPPEIGLVADGKKGDFLSYSGKIACTEKSYHLLKPFLGDSAEFLPAIHKKSDTKYYLLNILKKVPLDMDKAEVDSDQSGWIIMVIKHAFKESDVAGKKIFNVAECLPAGPIVSEEFKVFIEENKLEGLIFKKVC